MQSNLLSSIASGAATPFKLQEIFGDFPTLVFHSHNIGFWNANVIKKHLIDFMSSRRKQNRINPYSRAIHIQEKKSYTVLWLLAVLRSSEQKHFVGIVSVGGPDLTSI